MTDRYKEFVRELKRVMIEKQIKPYHLAKMLGRNQSTIYNWLNMKYAIGGEEMLEIMDKIMG